MKSTFTFILGATAGAVAYHFLVASVEKVAEVVVETTVG